MQLKTRGPLREFFASDGMTNFIVAVVTIVLGMVFGLVVLLFVTSPGNAWGAFTTIATGGFLHAGILTGIGRVLFYGSSYILIGLAVGLSFKTGAFNIGAMGQYVVGGITAVFVGILGKSAFGPAAWVVAFLAGGVAGAIWALLSAVLYAFRNVNIIISGMMLNYIGTLLVNWLIKKTPAVYDKSFMWTNLVPDNSKIPSLGMDKLFTGTSANIGFFIAVICAVIVFIIFKRTTVGYEMKVCGFNPDAAHYAGMNAKKTVIVSIIISGFLSGLAGAMYFQSGTIRYSISDTMIGNGWKGFSVALLAASNPIAMIFTGLFVSFLDVGGLFMQAYGLAPEMVDVITAAIIFFCAFTFKLKGLYFKLLRKAGVR